ncbi:MAG: ABC transporter permease [Tissierellia bacterium]|nr:ABC transporter permease [Tissierellia bacterium]
MNYLKRALLSISRKKTKSLLLFAIIFILGNVMAGAIAIRQGADNVEQNIKSQLGAVVTIDIDQKEIEKAMMEDPTGMSFDWPEPPNFELLQSISTSAYVKSYDFTTQSQVGSENLKAWVDPEMGQYISEDSMDKYWMYTIKGTQYAPVLSIEEGKSRLLDGRTFKPEEIEKGSSVVLISKLLADVNDLKVGDNMVVSTYILDWPESGGTPTETERRDLPLEIIGIYEPIESSQDQNSSGNKMYYSDDKQSKANTLIVPNLIVINEQRAQNEQWLKDAEIPEEEKERANQVYYQSLYILKSPDDIKAFKEETMPLLPDFYTIITNSDSYSIIAAPVEQTSKLATYVLYVAIGASILIISLVVLLFLRDRKHELGIYMSLGEHRSKVISQIVIEVMLVALLAISLSLITGNFLAQGLSNTMVRDQLMAENQDPYQDSTIYEEQWRFNEFAANISSQDISDNYQIAFSPAYISLFFLIGLGTVLVSTVVPMLYIVRLNPKKVLM